MPNKKISHNRTDKVLLLYRQLLLISNRSRSDIDFSQEHSSENELIFPTNVLAEILEEILAQFLVTHNSSVVSEDAACEVAKNNGNADDNVQVILGHVIDAVSKLKLH